MPVKLNKEDHVYTVDGVIKPAVSDVMRPLSERYYQKANKYGKMDIARVRGENIHNAIDCYLTFGIFDDTYYEYVNAFAQWMEDHHVAIRANEISLTDGTYCGTPDILAVVDGLLSLVDIKATYAINEELLEVQLAGYYNLYLAQGIRAEETAVLHLKPGKYIYKPIAINLAKWKELHEKFTHESHSDIAGSEEESI
jgi:hypothetical protein